MSRFLSSARSDLVPYTPGEQPADPEQYIKLNTNENPFPPSDEIMKKILQDTRPLQKYSSVDCIELRKKLACIEGIAPEELIMTNGSDEILNFAFMAFCDPEHPAAFPDISYGFYPVFATLNHVPYTEIPLKPDFTIDPEDYMHLNKTIFIANPNAPTGISMSRSKIEEIIRTNPDSIVVIDEAYVDFGSESCVPLIHKYDNLLVTRTFSKSRSLAGARLGYGIANDKLIQDLDTIRFSTNPYNVNSLTIAAAMAMLDEEESNRKRISRVISTRERIRKELIRRQFEVLPSGANFLFAKHPKMEGESFYQKMKEKKILIRHFSKDRIRDFNRITIGTDEQMDRFLEETDHILEEIQ